MLRHTAPARTDRLILRDLRNDEGGLLDALMAGMSPRSRYLRFHTPLRVLSAGMRRTLLDVDGRDRIALVAETDDGTPVGIARTIRDVRHRDEAELAVAVIDAWHRRGVGRMLVTAVAGRAEAEGVRRLVAHVLPENAAVLGLLRSVFPFCLTRHGDDGLVLVALLGEPMITMEDVLAA